MIELLFKPNRNKLKLDDVLIDSVGNDYNYAAEKLKIMKEVPQIYYYGQELPMQYVKKLKIESRDYLPTLHIIYDDVYNILHDIGMPGDNGKVVVILPSKSDNLSDIFLEFKIISFKTKGIVDNHNKQIEISGILNVENILIKNFESFKDKTSFEVCKELAEEIGLGLMSNVTASNDRMTWLNTGMNRYKFLSNEVIKKAWIGESSFVWSFIDFYYNINYIDVEKALNEDINNIKWIAKKDDTEDSIVIPPNLTNDMSMKDTNIFFAGEKVINNSTETSILRGYLRDISYYDVDGNWSEKAGSYKEYTLDTITTQDKNNVVYLKGEPGDVTFYNNNRTYHYLGKIDTANMHPDYLWAEMQNRENVLDLQKISMNITIPRPNFNIRRFEKVNLTFVNNNVNATERTRNFKLNGEWLITGTSFIWSGKNYYQNLTIVKREITYNE